MSCWNELFDSYMWLWLGLHVELILPERGVLSLFSMGTESLGEFGRAVENTSSEGLKCCYKSLHESQLYNTSEFRDQK